MKAATSTFTTNLQFFQRTNMKNVVSKLGLTAPTRGQVLVTTVVEGVRSLVVPKYFISYEWDSWTDHRNVLMELKASLERRNAQVFIDSGEIRTGDDLMTRIGGALLETTPMILLITAKYQEKCENPNSWIGHETSAALENGIAVIPLTVDDYTPEKTPRLSKTFVTNDLGLSLESFRYLLVWVV